MSVVGLALAAASGAAGLAVAAGTWLPQRARPAVVGGCTAGLGATGLVAGAAALQGERWSADLPDLLPLAGVHLAVDALSGLFMAVAGAVVLAVAVYGIGYATGHGLSSRAVQAVLPVFALTLILVPAAGSLSTFLVLWELMALTSLVLVVAEHRERPSVREAGLWYAVMTHMGLVLLLVGLMWFAAGVGGETFAALRAGAGSMSPGARDAVFVLAGLAFASKAGMVPLHAWLPRAHPEAPSHVSALMSAAMVNLGVYGIVRVGLDLLGGGPRWWWWLVLATGAVSAVYGILQAAMASDLKRLLAYSTSENLGLVLIGVGAAGMFHAAGNRALASLALAAALLHVVNHAAFKALLFCVAGSVLRATGLRDLDRLGGLRARMPVTAGLFAVAALGAVALPPGNGFISEWLLLQSLIHGLSVPGVSTAILLPLAVATIALSAGLAAAVFVKALGVGFFARPRSPQAAKAKESPPSMLAAMGLLAVACAALALVPGVLAPGLSRATAAAGIGGEQPLSGGGLQVRISQASASLWPLWIAAALVLALAVAAALVRLIARRRRRTGAKLWDCGGGAPTPRMAYTATSFAEPLQRVFDDVLAPEQDVNVTPVRESAYLVERVRFQRQVPDRIEHRLYRPVLAALTAVGASARRLAGGSVHLYLGYGFFALVAVLVALAVMQ
ncbi:proton-conducting transporter membrane subunit [Streptomyces sp. M3]|uniref:proton-conducting transporter transmembrane domain-containing protein n=1 Tax=Streptomyces sp. M3 TaxID=295102 RepID=UPI00100FE921|nr:proton-conducting transporter membrane subunit [Streptomyces sp. M3]